MLGELGALGIRAGFAHLTQALARYLFHQLRAGLAQLHAQIPGLVMVPDFGHEVLDELQGHQPVPALARGCNRRALFLRRRGVPEVGVVEGEEHGGVGRRGAEGHQIRFRQARALGHQVNGAAEGGEERL